MVDAELAPSEALAPTENSVGPRGHLCDAVSPAALRARSWPHPHHGRPARARASGKLGHQRPLLEEINF